MMLSHYGFRVMRAIVENSVVATSTRSLHRYEEYALLISRNQLVKRDAGRAERFRPHCERSPR